MNFEEVGVSGKLGATHVRQVIICRTDTSKIHRQILLDVKECLKGPHEETIQQKRLSTVKRK